MHTHNRNPDEEHDASYGRHYPARRGRIGHKQPDLIDRDDLLLKGVLIVLAGAVAIGFGNLVLGAALSHWGPL